MNEDTINQIDMSSLTSYKLGGKLFSFNKAYTMGILNVTPDSFSDGGKFFNKENAVEQALQMIKDGADIIDIGGESTRPGSERVDTEEQIERIIPVVEAVFKINPDIVISVDTTDSKVARKALKTGAHIINDVSGLTGDDEMINVISSFNAAVIIMHMKGTPKTMQQNPFYNNVVEEVHEFLFTQCKKAEEKSISKIFIDPGIGFGKRIEDNLKLIKELNKFEDINYPVVIGISRKSFIGKILELEVEKRDIATSFLNATAISKGARIIRTHNVKLGYQTCKLLNEMLAA